MTPEQRFTQIENLLHTITQLQARHDEAMARHDEAMARHDDAILRHDDAILRLDDAILRLDDAILRLDDAILRLDEQIEKQNAGIQDLIRVSRTILDSQTSAWDAIAFLGGKIDKLGDMVERVMKGFQKPNGHE